jgi:hypothetical protein
VSGQPRREQYIGTRPKILVDRKRLTPEDSKYDAGASQDEQAGNFVERCPVRTHPGSGEHAEQCSSNRWQRAQQSFRIPCFRVLPKVIRRKDRAIEVCAQVRSWLE